MLSLDVKSLARLRNVADPVRTLIAHGMSYFVANKMVNEKKDVINLKQLETICILFHCTPNDLLRWQPDAGKIYDDSLPLKALQRHIEDLQSASEALAQMPLEEIKEMVKQHRAQQKS